MSRGLGGGLDKWLTPYAMIMKINYLVDVVDDDDGDQEVLSVANDDGDGDDDVSKLLQQVKCVLKLH